MCDSYEKFLLRFVRYRQQKGMTQKETGCILGINQSQFSKLELGKVIISYKDLKALMEAGWDVDYLLTGKKSLFCGPELNKMISLPIEEKGKGELLSVLVWLLEQGIDKSSINISFETKCELQILKKRAKDKDSKTILHEVRQIIGMAQIPMSEKLGVNIKKYRMLEKEQAYPDAELLLRIYEETGCKPSLLLGIAHIEEKIISDLWNQIAPDVQKKILPLVEQVVWFLKS